MKRYVLVGLIFLSIQAMPAAGQDSYLLNPGDVLRISVWNEDALQQEILILPDGTISFPLVGILDVAGKTPAQVQESLREKLSRLIPDPEINLTVLSVAGNNIYIIGKVNRPGQFAMTSPTDVVQALSLAGGFTPYAKTDSIRILRRTQGKQRVILFDYTRIADGKALETNILLQSGDTIVVP